MNIVPETPAIYAVRECIERLIAARPHDRAWIAAACAAGAPMRGDVVSEVAGDLGHRYAQCRDCLNPIYQCHHCACGIDVGHGHIECAACPACIAEDERLHSLRAGGAS